MIQDLQKALSRMDRKEGKVARNRLVWATLHKNMDADMTTRAARLSEILKEDQVEMGSHSPLCGETIAAEVLFWIWMLTEKEGKNG